MNDCAFVMTAKQSIREAFVEASSFLAKRGVMEPQRNAQLLLEHVLELTGAAYYMALPEPFPADKQALWEACITRKACGEPAQYIIGVQEFYGLEFRVTNAVLIPRPETELLVEEVMRQVDRLWPAKETMQPPITIADIGTGSGAIAVTLAVKAPYLEVHASDLSEAALQIAKENAAAHNTSISFRQGNLLEPFTGMALDVVVSNPPYIPAGDLAGLMPEVRDYEPMLALDGGDDGLTPYRIMLQQLDQLGQIPRIIAFELGMGQARMVASMLQDYGAWDDIIIVPDLAGIERHVLGVRTRA